MLLASRLPAGHRLVPLAVRATGSHRPQFGAMLAALPQETDLLDGCYDALRNMTIYGMP